MVSSWDLYENSVLRYVLWFYWDFIWNVMFNTLNGFKYRLCEVFLDNLILNVNNEWASLVLYSFWALVIIVIDFRETSNIS